MTTGVCFILRFQIFSEYVWHSFADLLVKVQDVPPPDLQAEYVVARSPCKIATPERALKPRLGIDECAL